MAFKAFLTQFAHRSRSCGYSQRDNINGGRSRLRVQLRPDQTIIRGWAIALTGLVGGLIGLTVTLQPVHAEPRAANDGTGTNVRENGPGQFDIDGGQLSGDGANLFHSFQEFGLDANQIANFLSDANIRNIISRVVGGNPSMIDGLIRVSGGDSNLFLLNPSGVIFGQNARLDVPGSFSASTATGIGIGDRWFNVSGDNDYASLVGTPSQFAFRTQTPGSVINAGELRVADGQSITLLGGTVINTGTVEGSEILITAVPGESLVRLSQDGHVLSLEVAAIAPEQADAAGLVEWSAPVASIPELLTGGNVGHATGLQVNEDGTVSLNGSQISTEPGSVTVSGRVDATNTSPTGEARGGNVAIAGSDIQVIDATIDASGRTGGGEIYIGGDQRGEGTFPTSDRTIVNANSAISANAIETGDGGRIIVWADDATHFSGSINAQGGATVGDGGFVEISGKRTLVFLGVVDLSAENGALGTLLLDPENIRIVNGDGGANDGQLGDGQILAGDSPGATFTISEDVLENIIGNVILEATNDITIETLRGGGDVGLVFLAFDPVTGVPGGTITFRADSDLDGSGNFSMDPGDIIVTSGRDITIQGANVTTGDIVSQSLFNFGQDGLFTFGESGDIRIEADNDITVGHLIAQNDDIESSDPDAGDVTLVSQRGDILVQSIDARSFFGEGGTVLLDGDTVRIAATIGDSIFASGTDTSIDVTGEISNNVEISPGFNNGPPEGDGQITIRHAGGPENVPFTVGDASVNGSAGELLQGIVLDENGNEVGRRAIAPNQSFVVRPNGGEAPGTPAGITIESVNTPPTITGPATVVIRQNQRARIDIQDYLPATDPNRDTVTVTIESITIPRGGSLRLNGRNVTPGTVVTAEDTLVYTPPRRRRENVDAFFTLRADDGVATDAQAVQVDVGVVRRRRDDNGNGNGNNGNGNNGGELPDDSGDSILDLPGELDRDINGEEVDDVEEPGVANFNIENANRTDVLDTYISSLEYEYVQSFTDYLNLPVQPELTTAEEAKDIARLIEEATGEKPAFIYVNFVPEALDVLPGDRGEPRDTDQLELVVIT
ncbi:MAG: filamentous hemagglutinin N-terminal domain-containing protein, partial [Leptolyngbyaceae bacterium]|nr:filamentous hemagglutinin N-terminal domain-containing protein [Leptolyngbyaceae bacterium]